MQRLSSLSECLFHWRGDNFAHSIAQRRHIGFGKPFGVNRVVQNDGYLCRPEHPVTRAVMLEGSHQADGHDGDAELLRNAKAAVLELIHVAVACTLGFRKNDQAGAAVNGVLRQPPHALEVRRAANVWHGNIPEALHQPAIRWNLEMRFQLPATDELRNGAVEHERIENIDMV